MACDSFEPRLGRLAAQKVVVGQRAVQLGQQDVVVAAQADQLGQVAGALVEQSLVLGRDGALAGGGGLLGAGRAALVARGLAQFGHQGSLRVAASLLLQRGRFAACPQLVQSLLRRRQLGLALFGLSGCTAAPGSRPGWPAPGRYRAPNAACAGCPARR